MKKLKLTALALAAACLLAACSGGASSAAPAAETPTAAPAAEATAAPAAETPTEAPAPTEAPTEAPATEGAEALALVPEYTYSDVTVAQDPDVPDFLTPDQQDLFRAAKRMYNGMAGCSIGFDPDYSDHFTVGVGDSTWEYMLDNGFASYADFEAAMHAVFTESFCIELMTAAPANPMIEHEGKLYTTGGDRGGNITFVESKYVLNSETDTTINIDLVGTYNDDVMEYEDPSKRDTSLDTTETYSITMEKTEDGWRFASFAIPY